MDALKKAELAKRKTQSDSASIAPPPSLGSEITLEPAPPESTAYPSLDFDVGPASLPPLSDNLGSLDSQFETTRPAVTSPPKPDEPPVAKLNSDLPFASKKVDTAARGHDGFPKALPSAPAQPETQAERETVKNLFETKQVAPSRKTFAIAMGVVTLFGVGAIGLYFWIQLQPKSGLMATPANKLPPVSPIVASPPAMPATAPVIAGLPVASEQPPAREPEPAGSAPTGETSRAEKAPAIPASKLFRVTTSLPQLNTAVTRGYDALNRGDDEAAKAAYEQALSADPKNLDALSGLASLYLRQGKSELAAEYYLQILEADPKNSLAQAGLIDLQGRMSPAEAESRLRQALSAQPDSPALNFSLGNAYSRSRRWNEAQQSYFKAMSGDPGNPDYLFNLAISLDQMHQDKLAADFYAQAIAAANSRPASFDKSQARDRLQKLQQLP